MPDAPAGRSSEEDLFKEALLRNTLRRRIMELLQRQPGMNRHQVAVELGVHVNTVIFHVDRLTQQGVLESRPSTKGRETLLFPADMVHLWDHPSTRVLFGRGPPRDVARFFAANPGADTSDAAEALGLSIYSVRRHLRLLEENDLVERFRISRQVIYKAAPELTQWLRELDRWSSRTHLQSE